MKPLSKKTIKNILQCSTAIVIAGAFTYSSALAYAADDTNETNLPVVEMPSLTTDLVSPSPNETILPNGDSQAENDLLESHPLKPGNFLYFSNIAFGNSHKTIALTAALNKIKNPIAKAALEKNIEKAVAKIQAKQEQFNKKHLENRSNEKKLAEQVQQDELEKQDNEKNIREKDQQKDLKQKTKQIEAHQHNGKGNGKHNRHMKH
ncbi:hypothetical protein ACE38V_02505 [Cytobacillus sp. Hz8]|uniref:hypothetical protein n=1 Tax=Cytobacillus sp. Hz8 TaxID=3347168 RepID=UPI0035DD0C03